VRVHGFEGRADERGAQERPAEEVLGEHGDDDAVSPERVLRRPASWVGAGRAFAERRQERGEGVGREIWEHLSLLEKVWLHLS